MVGLTARDEIERGESEREMRFCQALYEGCGGV